MSARWSVVLLALFAVLLGVPACDDGPAAEVEVSKATHQDVIVIVIDTLRGDAVDRARTPMLDQLVEAGQSAHAWAPGTWTAPSTLSLMTGSHLRDHGWDLPFPDKLDPGEVYPSLDDRTTLAEVMKAAGYQTVGVYANPLLTRKLGWERGFDIWRRTTDVKLPRRLTKAMSKVKADEPLFLYVHYLGPHQPLRPSQAAGDYWGVDWDFLSRYRKGLRRKFIKNGPQHGKDQYYRLYHAEVEDSDRRLKKLWRVLGPRADDALVIVTSDHGEMLGEHGVFGHGSHVWDPLTRVPLIARGTDVTLPKVMSTTGIPDLVTRSVGIGVEWPETVESAWPLVSQREGKMAVSANGTLRGVWNDAASREVAVFDLNTDPQENAPLVGLAPRAALQILRTHFETAHEARQIEPEKGEMDDETRKLLEELGYMGVEDEVMPEGQAAPAAKTDTGTD